VALILLPLAAAATVGAPTTSHGVKPSPLGTARDAAALEAVIESIVVCRRTGDASRIPKIPKTIGHKGGRPHG